MSEAIQFFEYLYSKPSQALFILLLITYFYLLKGKYQEWSKRMDTNEERHSLLANKVDSALVRLTSVLKQHDDSFTTNYSMNRETQRIFIAHVQELIKSLVMRQEILEKVGRELEGNLSRISSMLEKFKGVIALRDELKDLKGKVLHVDENHKTIIKAINEANARKGNK